MRPLLPSETALVLGGGGAKGAYEVGAIEALDELGIRAGSVFGVSVGALNAAMYAQGTMEEARQMWENIKLSDVINEEGLNLGDDIEAAFDHPEKLLDFLKNNAQRKGLDISPFVEMLRRTVNEDAVRKSSIRLGLVTTKFPTLTMVEKRVEDMAPGMLHDWLLASASCFPLFPMAQVGGDRYIDGGYCDNAPVDMAVRSGARHIIAIDIGKHRSHTQYDKRPNVTYIRTAHPLGRMLGFDAELSRRNRILGYNDTMRAFGHLRGTAYSFDPVDAQALYGRAEDFIIRLTALESDLQGSNAITRRDDSAPIFEVLEEGLREKADVIDYFLRACEFCAQTAGVSPAQVLTFDQLRGELHARLPLEKAESMIGSLLGGRVGALFTKPQIDRKLVISCLYQLIQREGTSFPLAAQTFTAFPKEMICALTLKAIL